MVANVQINYLHGGQVDAAINDHINEVLTGGSGWGPALNNIDIQYNIRVVVSDDLNRFDGLCVPKLKLFGNTVYTTANAKVRGLFGPNNPGYNEYDMVIFLRRAELDLNNNGARIRRLVMHEACHGMGFVSLCNIVNDLGVYSSPEVLDNLQAALGDLFNQIPFRQGLVANLRYFQDHPTNFCRLWNDLPQNRSNNFAIKLRGGLQGVTIRNGPNQISIYTPANFVPFTSADHVDPAIHPNSLMIPIIPAIDVLDDQTRFIMNQLGWDIQANQRIN